LCYQHLSVHAYPDQRAAAASERATYDVTRQAGRRAAAAQQLWPARRVHGGNIAKLVVVVGLLAPCMAVRGAITYCRRHTATTPRPRMYDTHTKAYIYTYTDTARYTHVRGGERRALPVHSRHTANRPRLATRSALRASAATRRSSGIRETSDYKTTRPRHTSQETLARRRQALLEAWRLRRPTARVDLARRSTYRTHIVRVLKSDVVARLPA
jgi:hypothetical protein